MRAEGGGRSGLTWMKRISSLIPHPSSLGMLAVLISLPIAASRAKNDGTTPPARRWALRAADTRRGYRRRHQAAIGDDFADAERGDHQRRDGEARGEVRRCRAGQGGGERSGAEEAAARSRCSRSTRAWRSAESCRWRWRRRRRRRALRARRRPRRSRGAMRNPLLMPARRCVRERDHDAQGPDCWRSPLPPPPAAPSSRSRRDATRDRIGSDMDEAVAKRAQPAGARER